VWGSTWLAIKIGLSGMPPLLGAGLRFLLASVILFGIVKVWRIPVPMTSDAKKIYATLAILSFTIPFAFVYWAEQYIPTGLASILFAGYPFWVALFSYFMLKNEPLSLFKISGIVLAFTGMLVIFSGDVHVADTRAFIAMILMVTNTILQAYSLVLVKKIGQPINPFAFNFVGMMISSILLIGASIMLESHDGIVWNTATVGSILYLGIVGSVIVFAAYFWLLKRVEAVYLSLVSFINPIVAVLLGAIVLGEKLDPDVFLGASFVLLGLLVANGRALYARVSEVLE
jgi:drug/metabolite transporter (DMT)-like permease